MNEEAQTATTQILENEPVGSAVVFPYVSAQPKPVAAKEPLNTTPINFELLAMVLGSDDQSYMKDILSIFWKTVAETADELANLATARDASALRDAAHSAKGASASAGAEQLAALLKHLQDAAEEENWPEIDLIIPQVGAAFTQLERFLQGYN